jgi:hypothetical protein
LARITTSSANEEIGKTISPTTTTQDVQMNFVRPIANPFLKKFSSNVARAHHAKSPGDAETDGRN